MSHFATLVFALAILALFTLDRDKARTSKALWIPVVWVSIVCSRPVSLWLEMSPPSSADVYLEGSPIDRAVFTVLMVAAFLVLSTRWAEVSAILRGIVHFSCFSFTAVSASSGRITRLWPSRGGLRPWAIWQWS